MKKDKLDFSSQQLDYLKEMLNIGAGNAATALSSMLKIDVKILVPIVRNLPTTQIASIFESPSLTVAFVRMHMIGDIAGDILFILPDNHRQKLISLTKQVSLGESWHFKLGNMSSSLRSLQRAEFNNSVINEIGNIIVGVYLGAIHDFCRLNIYHSVPTLAIDMIQSLLDEITIAYDRQSQEIITIENEFHIEKEHIKSSILIIPSLESVKKLVDSVEFAKESLYKE